MQPLPPKVASALVELCHYIKADYNLLPRAHQNDILHLHESMWYYVNFIVTGKALPTWDAQFLIENYDSVISERLKELGIEATREVTYKEAL